MARDPVLHPPPAATGRKQINDSLRNSPMKTVPGFGIPPLAPIGNPSPKSSDGTISRPGAYLVHFPAFLMVNSNARPGIMHRAFSGSILFYLPVSAGYSVCFLSAVSKSLSQNAGYNVHRKPHHSWHNTVPVQ